MFIRAIQILYLVSAVLGNIIELHNLKLGELVMQRKNRYVYTDFKKGPLKDAKIDFDLTIQPHNYADDQKLALYIVVAKSSVAYLVQEALKHHVPRKNYKSVEEIISPLRPMIALFETVDLKGSE